MSPIRTLVTSLSLALSVLACSSPTTDPPTEADTSTGLPDAVDDTSAPDADTTLDDADAGETSADTALDTADTSSDVDDATPDVDDTTPDVDDTTPDVDDTTPDIDDATPDVDDTELDDTSAPDADSGAPDTDAGDTDGGIIEPPDHRVVASSTVWPADPRPGETVRIRYDGPLADVDGLGIHYGFNGWNDIDGVGFTAQEDGTDNIDFFAEAPLERDADGAYIDLVLPAEVRAVHYVFYAGPHDDRAWDNNDDADFQLGVGHPLIGPFLTFGHGVDAGTGVVVHAHTGDACAAELLVRGDRGHQRFTTDRAHAHHITVDGLEPGMPYTYTLRCDGRPLGPERELRTVDTRDARARFAVIGDAQSKGEVVRWPESAAAIEATDAEFILTVGDLAWNDRPGLWWSYFDAARDLFGSRAQIPVVGNHDTPTTGRHLDWTSFEHYFDLEDHTWRTLDVGELRFVLFNSEDPDAFDPDTGLQYAWAAETLAETPGSIRWVFAGMHIGPYNTGVRHNEEQGDYRDLTEHFEGRVDWLFMGHEHLYQRFVPLSYNSEIVSSHGRDAGVGYLLVPPAGAWPEQRVLAADGEYARRRDRVAFPDLSDGRDWVDSENGFTLISIDGEDFALTTYGVGNHGEALPAHVIDTYSYTRTR